MEEGRLERKRKETEKRYDREGGERMVETRQKMERGREE